MCTFEKVSKLPKYCYCVKLHSNFQCDFGKSNTKLGTNRNNAIDEAMQ